MLPKNRSYFLTVASVILLIQMGCSHDLEQNQDVASANAEYLNQMSKAWAEYYGISDPPEVIPIRFITHEEADLAHHECLLDAGFTLGGDGLITVPEGQKSVFALAEYTCRMQYPIPEKYTQAWTDKEINAQYEWTVKFLKPCLEDRGHPISDPPSKAVFMETWGSESFFPFAEVTIDEGLSAKEYNDAWMALEIQCPQIIPDEILWGTLTIEQWVARTETNN